MTHLACLCTCPDVGTAERVAEALVQERLAACVNILPGVRSIDHWKGAIQRSDETLLLAKTVGDRLPALVARFQAVHTDELPEVVAVEIAGGLAGYLDWVAEQTRGA